MSTHLTLVLDRFEEGFGVFEGFGNVPRGLLPTAIKEGDHLKVELGEHTVSFRVESSLREDARAALQALRDSLARPIPNVEPSRSVESPSDAALSGAMGNEQSEEIIEL